MTEALETIVARKREVRAPQRRYAGTVGVCGMDTGRFNEFAVALGNLDMPAGWTVEGALNYSETRARNFHAEHFKGDHLWFMDDDHAFAPDTLRRLLALDFDIVAPLVLQRKAPFATVAIVDGKYLSLDEVEDHLAATGLLEVQATGTAGMLIHRRVFDELDMPYFFHGEDDRDGAPTSDVLFCRKARAAGFKIYVDTSVALTHFNVMGVTPRYMDGRWYTGISVANREIGRL